MSSLRGFVRKAIPFSTGIYEFADDKARLFASRRHLKTLRASPDEIWLDIGGGNRAGSGGWLTIDVTHECDIYWDLRMGIPFGDGTVSRFYSSHLFEHLTYVEAQGLLDECLRALKPGGSFSICVPNAGMYIAGYNGEREIPSDYYGWKPAYNNTTRIDALNYVAYMDGEHKYMFDQENLLHILKAKGFERVEQRTFDPLTDMQERDFESIYAIGYKPA